jgi:NitT/TauT family transport system substrate-binding protein
MAFGRAVAVALLVLATWPVWAQAVRGPSKARVLLDGPASVEHAGLFQAQASGLFRRHLLEVTLEPGGNVEARVQAVLSGQADFAIVPNGYVVLDLVARNVPIRAIAALFQREPSVLIAHEASGHDSFQQIKGVPVLADSAVRSGWWAFLRARYGYTDAQLRPRGEGLAAFLADNSAVLAGQLTVEPFALGAEGRRGAVILLAADGGYPGYGQIIIATERTVRFRPDLAQPLAEGAAEGWYSYLYGKPALGDAAMLRANPRLRQEALSFGRAALMENDILEANEAKRDGIGAMSPARWAALVAPVVRIGRYPAALNVERAYSLDYVNHQAGMALKRRFQQ